LFGKGSSKFLEGLFSYFVKERFSSKTEFLFVIDNNVEISDRKRISNFSFLLLTKGYSVKILNNQVVGFGDNFSSSKKYERHAKVCSIYNSVLKYIQTDVLYLVEDDNLPSVGTFEKLSFHIYPKTNIVAASAKYRSRATPDKSCCSLSLDKWTPEDYNGTDLKFVKMTGGGCLVILSYIFKEAFPLQCTKNEIGNISLGWDASLGKYINSKGKKIILDKSVECKHLAKEVLDFLENKQDKKENYGRQHSSLL
jgi:hypothetical protein